MQVAELKKKRFEFIRVTGEIDQFSDIKAFCGGHSKISYENAPGIGDFWDIQVFCELKSKWVTVPDHSYVVKLDDGLFCVLDSCAFNDYYNVYNEETKIGDKDGENREKLIKRFEILYIQYINTDPDSINHCSFKEYALKNWDNVDIKID